MTFMEGVGFTGSRVDRADRLRLNEQAVEALKADGRARLLSLSGVDPDLSPDGQLTWKPLNGESSLIFLGLDGDVPLFAPLERLPQPIPGAWTVFGLLQNLPYSEAALWGTARSLIAWHNRHLFCANCGAETAVFRSGWGRKCPRCSADHFPRVDPVVIMLAEHDGRVLVGRQPQYPPRRYSALAGFIEPGESIEEAVARELEEEAGIRVTEVAYVASQPWPFPGQLMMACIATAADDALTIDRTELDDAKWVDRAGVEAALRGEEDAPFAAPPHFAIAHTLFRRWLEGA